ncbi:HET domain-containing protein [Aspergillus ibericus CBS 121593]|uniref:Heterokaryon incompatibility domain-containing protein n=1 Tax=Aspergillus ibericus CBS 121593 TaxID=1448316 RepID=A0A395GTB0_9EURO|nr:hypothetical protein BO80DRAFT_504294 [Aspergillus ibericus CBS 121593]RAK98188.1 hypothetical protein BO80DRAFT_504294 [Aspergillus ibericus CBS 121593]
MYTKLDPDKRQIRLASILPGRWSESVSCNLKVVSLDDKPKYEALSYTWGDLSNKIPICLEESRFLVTKNLHMALRRLRRAAGTRDIWVDALCINQEDKPEKTRQIQLMKEIYSYASEVQIYLGESGVLETIPEEEQSTWADPPRLYWCEEKDVPSFNDYKTWQTMSDDQLSQLNPTTRLRQAISSAYIVLSILADAGCLSMARLDDANSEVWSETLAVLGHIADSPWWQRVWVVEEAILSQTATVIYGEVVAPLDIVERGGSMIHVHMERCCRDFYRSLPNSLQSHLLAIGQHTSALEILRKEWGYYADKEAERLQRFLEMTRTRGAYDGRDKIYSLLGLTRDCSERLFIVPDYTVPVSEVYIQMAWQIIRQANTLEILATVERKVPNSEIPTWCPDWRSRGNGEERDLWVHSRSWKFNAGPSNGRVADLHNRVLAVRGVHVDVVAKTAPPLSQDEPLAPRLDEFAHMARYYADALCPYTRGGAVKEAFWRTMLNDALETKPNEHMQLMAEDESFFVWWRRLRDRGGVGEVYDPFQEHLRAIARSFWLPNDNRAFFTTQKGYMGFGPPDMKPGDVVAVLLGSRMPFVLRQMPATCCVGDGGQGRKYCSVVGYCYLHGVMNGQAVGKDATICGINLV